MSTASAQSANNQESRSSLLEAVELTKHFGGTKKMLFGARRNPVQAVNAVSLTLPKGGALGVVGESGCGKSTLARMLVGLIRPTSGTIRFEGREIGSSNSFDRRELYRKIQFVFQDPYSSLNPRKTVRQILSEPLRRLLGMESGDRERRLLELMTLVNMRPEALDKNPHEFSGGQNQRVGIARALASEPRLVILDEPVSALDVSIQAQILKLLKKLRAELGLTYVFISHDLAVVEYICDRVVVMYLGNIVEEGDTTQIFSAPRHPYTYVLLRSVPNPGERSATRLSISGELPDPANPPAGCPFVTRCYRATERCSSEKPPMVEYEPGHRAACFYGDSPVPPPEEPV